MHHLRSGLGFVVSCALATASSIQITVSNQTDATAGINGRLHMFMSTSFQPADWDYQFFQMSPQQREADLWQLAPWHINLQSITGANPQTGPNSWDFTENNAVNQPILALADHSPLYEIVPPPFITQQNGSVQTSDFPAFAAYSANLVRYFNTGGFDAGGTHYQSSSPYHITWWGIYNEPNGNGMTPQAYTDLYNLTVPAMQAADSNIKFVAVELSDYNGQAQAFLPAFVQNVTAQVDVVATHFYGTCNQSTPDSQVFGSVVTFTSEIEEIQKDLQLNPKLANTPIWVTEDNVNADYSDSNGMSVCNPGQKFVLDLRGSDAFFAAWRPLVFARLARVGVQSLHHWDYDSDQQYGEVNYGTGAKQLSYWVDYWLGHLFPAQPGANILQVQNPDLTGLGVDAFAVQNDDGSVVIMLVDHEIYGNANVDNGPGNPLTFQVDVSSLGSFSSVTEFTIDANTDPLNGPRPQNYPFAANLQASTAGYGVVFFKLNKTAPAILPGGIVNAASFQGSAVAPGEIVTLFGNGLGPSTLTHEQFTAPGFFDNFLAGTRVLFDGIPAPLVYTAQGYVSAIVPWEVAGQAVTQIQLQYMGTTTPAVIMPVVSSALGIFTVPPTGTGGGAIRDVNEKLVDANNPVHAGDWISIYLTGVGVGDPAVLDGEIATGKSPANYPVSVTIGGLPATRIEYAGRAPGLVYGVVQVNAQIPPGVPPGNAPLVITLGSSQSQAGVTVAMQ